MKVSHCQAYRCRCRKCQRLGIFAEEREPRCQGILLRGEVFFIEVDAKALNPLKTTSIHNAARMVDSCATNPIRGGPARKPTYPAVVTTARLGPGALPSMFPAAANVLGIIVARPAPAHVNPTNAQPALPNNNTKTSPGAAKRAP